MIKGENILLYLSFISTGLEVLQANSSLWIGRQSRKINTLKQFPLILIGLLLIAPNIYAQNEHDAQLALGYVHAQDRLFQMEMMRRVGWGRLS